MRPSVGIIIFVILLLSARAQGYGDSFEYGLWQKAYTSDSIDSSNKSPTYGSHNLQRSEELTSEISSRFTPSVRIYSKDFADNINFLDFHRSRDAHANLTGRPIDCRSSELHRESSLTMAQAAIARVSSRFSDSPRVYYGDTPVNLTQADFHAFSRADVNLKLENRMHLSRLPENVEISIYDKHVFEPMDSGNGAILVENLTSDSLAFEPVQSEPSPESTPANKSRIVVNAGDSIQAAINDLAPGGVLEINSGTYNELLQIDKPLTIKGVDVGGGLPVIDAHRRGNAVEVSADQVILEGIITVNSSIYYQGAGVRFSSSNNSSIERIVSNNNYHGIELDHSNENIISECNISNNSHFGIELGDSNNNLLSQSNISNTETGVRFYYSSGNTFEKSYVANTAYPLAFSDSSHNLINNNTFEDNQNNLVVSEGNEFSDNTGINVTKKDSGDSLNQGSFDTTVTASQGETDPPGKTESSSTAAEPPGGKWVPMPIYGEVYQDFADEAAGTLVFNPPAVMVTGVGEWIDARIGLENAANLVEGLLGKGDVKFRYIDAKTNLTYVVKLECDSGFEIQAKRPDAQILGEDPALWLWWVTPEKAGNHTLILSVDLQLDKPPYNCKCVNVTQWPVQVRVTEPTFEQWLMGIFDSVLSSTKAIIAFLASIFSLILLHRQLKKKNEEKGKS